MHIDINSPEEVFCSFPHEELSVDLVIEFGPFGLKLPSSCLNEGVGALETNINTGEVHVVVNRHGCTQQSRQTKLHVPY